MKRLRSIFVLCAPGIVGFGDLERSWPRPLKPAGRIVPDTSLNERRRSSPIPRFGRAAFGDVTIEQ